MWFSERHDRFPIRLANVSAYFRRLKRRFAQAILVRARSAALIWSVRRTSFRPTVNRSRRWRWSMRSAGSPHAQQNNT